MIRADSASGSSGHSSQLVHERLLAPMFNGAVGDVVKAEGEEAAVWSLEL